MEFSADFAPVCGNCIVSDFARRRPRGFSTTFLEASQAEWNMNAPVRQKMLQWCGKPSFAPMKFVNWLKPCSINQIIRLKVKPDSERNFRLSTSNPEKFLSIMKAVDNDTIYKINGTEF